MGSSVVETVVFAPLACTVPTASEIALNVRFSRPGCEERDVLGLKTVSTFCSLNSIHLTTIGIQDRI